MTEQLFSFPDIDPVALGLGPFEVRWYALSYIAGLLLGWTLLRRRVSAGSAPFTHAQLDFLMNAALVGILLGGRLGYVLFYNLSYFLSNPIAIAKVWEGGMAFHGGMIGVVFAVLYFSRRTNIPVLAVGDLIALVAPIGLFFGRVANFINDELHGRITTHPFGIIFPSGGDLPRHPSQLYEAVLEGIVLFLVLYICDKRLSARYNSAKPHGILVAIFLIGYGLGRLAVEFVREPDPHLGILVEIGPLGISMGQVLSAPMVLLGIFCLMIIRRK